MKINTEDTIAAISTSMTPGGISIIRVSGERAAVIADKILCDTPKGEKKKSVVSQKPNTILHAYAFDRGHILDEVMVSYFRGPKSFTGEDTVEINAHGGVLVSRNILEALLRAGARLAEPGEFTRRAFLNGRIDLSEAEAVMDVINAKNNYALSSSLKQLGGVLSEKVKNLRNKLLDDIAYIEAALDDPEHFSLEGYSPVLQKELALLIDETDSLVKSFSQGRMMKEGIKTAILGKPNAGKSSVLNALTGYERAIVTEYAGTTRDILEENIHLEGISLLLMDTAGLHETQDPIEKIGIQKANEAATDADLILYVIDSSLPFDPDDKENVDNFRDKKGIIILNKSDLPAFVTEETLREKGFSFPVVTVSARDHTGLNQLSKCIVDMMFQGDISFNDEVVITNIRHRDCLEKARKALCLAVEGIEKEMPEDLLTIDMLDAYRELGFILGEEIEDDLADRIFEKFCMGK